MEIGNRQNRHILEIRRQRSRLQSHRLLLKRHR